MAIEIGSRSGRLGSLLGQGAAQGIQSHLNDIAQQRLMQLKGQQSMAKDQQRVATQTNALDQLVKQSGMPIPAQIIQTLGSLDARAFDDAYNNLLSGAQFGGQQPMQQAQEANPMQQLMQGGAPQSQQAEGVMPQQGMGQQQQMPQEEVIPESSHPRDESALPAFASASARQHQEAMRQKDRQFRFKVTEDFRKGINTDRKDYRETMPVINEMKKLDKSGALNSPGFLKILELAGVDDVQALKSPESQQFQKLETFFLRNLKNVFGARPTQFDVQQYIKGIPTLMNSAEGRKRIYRDIKNALKMKKVLIDAYDKVYAKYKGDLPEDVSRIVDEMTRDKIDQIYNKTSFGKDNAKSQTFDDLPPIQQAGNNIYEDTQTGDLKKVINGQWVTVDKSGNPIGGQ